MAALPGSLRVAVSLRLVLEGDAPLGIRPSSSCAFRTVFWPPSPLVSSVLPKTSSARFPLAAFKILSCFGFRRSQRCV